MIQTLYSNFFLSSPRAPCRGAMEHRSRRFCSAGQCNDRNSFRTSVQTHPRSFRKSRPRCKNIVHQNHRTANHTSSPRRVYRHRSMQQFPAFLSSVILKLRCAAALLQPIQTALKSRHLRHLLRNERRLIKPPAPLPLPMQRNWNQHRGGWKNIRAPAQHPMGKGRDEIMPIVALQGQNHTAGFGIIRKHRAPTGPGTRVV